MKETLVIFISSLFMLLVLTGCRAPDDGVEAEPSIPSKGGTPWKPNPGEGGTPTIPNLSFITHQIPLAHPRGYLGGLDIIYVDGNIHVAFMMKVLDVEMGTEFYRLYYGNNETGSWRLWYLKSSTTLFYFFRTGNHSSNAIRIHRTREGKPYILYIDSNNQLVSLYKENNQFFEKVLVTNQVGSFASALSLTDNKLHVATTARYYNTREVRYFAFVDNSLVDSFVYSGSISPGSSENHLTINLYYNRPIILTKYYDSSLRTGRFLMIKDRQGYIIANGVNPSGVFSTYWDGFELKSCYRNVLNERFEVTINIDHLSTNSKKAEYSRNNNYPLHCFVSSYSQIPFVRYDLNQAYSTDLEIYSWERMGEVNTNRLPLQGIRFIDTRNGFVFFGGLDSQTGRPQFLQLQ
ncbi:MAG: hypothetical protein K9K67_11655 [Bacteriovoracaceae bacterium]|nr:hypothetical protein [Bacteriovoracaceae bacterium]